MNKTYLKIYPDKAIKMSFQESLDVLKNMIGIKVFESIFDKNAIVETPIKNEKNSNWLKSTKMIGINPRITKSLWNIVKYAFTFSENSIHLLPLWECGCDSSLYSPINWKINPEFYEPELSKLGFETIESQLEVTIKALHALNKTVGFDVVLHSDKYSEICFIHPDYFEWIKLNDNKTSQLFYPDVEPDLVHEDVKKIIISYLQENKSANGQNIQDEILENFFSDEISDNLKDEILFGNDYNLRLKRRLKLMELVRNKGYELIPVTEYSPSRPILFDKIHYENNTNWAEFKLENKKPESTIFNNLTPYKFYNIDNDGYPIKNGYNQKVWTYFINQISYFQKRYNFDFIRADMGHNQTSHAHNNPDKDNTTKEIWAELKKEIQKTTPYFGIFAESFFLENGYINPYQDMENKNFDTILGVMHYKHLERRYIEKLKEYSEMQKPYTPCNAIMTIDSHKEIYNDLHESPKANEIRYFTSLFLNLPSYMGMGYELKNLCSNVKEEYTSTFINYHSKSFVWGQNYAFYDEICKMRDVYNEINSKIKNAKQNFITTNFDTSLAWEYNTEYLFIINLNTNSNGQNIELKNLDENFSLELIYSNYTNKKEKIRTKIVTEIKNVRTGEARIYKIHKDIEHVKDFNLLIATTECLPYSKMGGIGDINCDFIKEFQIKYPNCKVKVVLPYDINSIYAHSNNDKFSAKKIDNFTFEYGLYKTKANVYYSKTDEIEAYLLDIPELNCDISDKIKNTIYCHGIYNLIKRLKKTFKPQIIQTTDWGLSVLVDLIKNDKKLNSKIIHIIHNAGDRYHGELFPFLHAVYGLNKNELKILTNDKTFRKYIDLIKHSNPDLFKGIPKNITTTLKIIIENFGYLITCNKEIFQKIDMLISVLFEDKKCWEYKISNTITVNYNPLANAISSSDYWVTDSNEYYSEITGENSNIKSNSVKNALKDNVHKGAGILCAIDKDRYNPENQEEIIIPFNTSGALEGKLKNKEIIQSYFGKDKKIVPNEYFTNKNYFIGKIGYLEENKEIPLLLCTSRLDIEQKGLDIFIDTLDKLINENVEFQVILALSGVSRYKQEKTTKLIENITQNEKYFGKIVLIDNFIPVQQYLAGSDMLIFPSRYEPCGLVHFQAMKYGCIPVVANTGGLKESITTLEENYKEANGFKTEYDLKTISNPDEILTTEIKKAINIYKNDKATWFHIINNTMSYDSSWAQSTQEFHRIYQGLI